MKGKRPCNLKEALKEKLSEKEMSLLITSYDSLGDIAVIQVPKELQKKARIIGESLLELNKQFKTVCMVSGKHSGKYRKQPVKVIAGQRTKTALYKENGCIFMVELGKVFFSPRLGTERLRISRLIGENEVIGAFFAGVGPFPIVFCRLSGMKKAYAIELNPQAYKSLIHNISLNKCQKKIEAILGDVGKAAPKHLKGKCHRVVMPLPEGSANFLDSALAALKPAGGIVHFYRFVEKKDAGKPVREIKEAAKKAGFAVKILRDEKVRSFSASKEQHVVDFFAKEKKLK